MNLVDIDYPLLRALSPADKLRAAANILAVDESVARLVVAMALCDLEATYPRQLEPK